MLQDEFDKVKNKDTQAHIVKTIKVTGFKVLVDLPLTISTILVRSKNDSKKVSCYKMNI